MKNIKNNLQLKTYNNTQNYQLYKELKIIFLKNYKTVFGILIELKPLKYVS